MRSTHTTHLNTSAIRIWLVAVLPTARLVEAMVALVLADHLLRQQAQCGDMS